MFNKRFQIKKVKIASVSFLISCSTVIAIIILWLVVTKLQIINALFLPSPRKIWEAFVIIYKNGYKTYSFWQHISSSLIRISIAFGLAIITAVPLGLASGYIPWLKAILEPVIEFIRPLPPLAYYTLLVLWLGIDNGSKIMLLFIACFTPIYIACVSSVLRIPQNYLRNAASLGANKIQIFFLVIFPSTLPDIFLSMRTALGVGYTTLVASEMVAARSGIGWMVLDASNFLRSDIVFLGIIIMGIMGIILDQIIRALKKIFVSWEGKDI
jgi:taurine transport system permease protein